MKENLRLGGAQIPCTDDLGKNVKIISEAIDWAAENDVDYLITPEGSLTGYITNFDSHNGRTFDDVLSSLDAVVQYASSKSVGLCLGTMFIENGQRENQIRFYKNDGSFLGKTSKTYIIPEYDQTVPNGHIDNIDMYHETQNFWALGLVCNDLWGGPLENKLAIPLVAKPLGSQIIIHCTNGYRGEVPEYDDLMNSWHDANLRMMSWYSGVPIITVDNCYYMQGEEYHGKTSSESGVVINGQWMTKVPRIGTQYFYYDFPIQKIINYGYRYSEWLPGWVRKLSAQ